VTRAAAAVAPLVLLAHAAWTSTAAAQTKDAPKPPLLESPDGVPVTFTANDPSMRIYLARGDVPSSAPPGAYTRVGVAPVTLRLAPGTYTVEAESPNASTGHERMLVEPAAPMRVDVRSGNAVVKTTAGVLIGLGVVAAILGVVAIVSISANDSRYDRFGIGLPLIFSGAGAAGIGFGMTALGSTDVHVPRLPPGGAPHPPPTGAVLPSVVVRF
jgi:hypothetical protein